LPDCACEQNGLANGLQTSVFEINSEAMQKVLAPLLLAAALIGGGIGASAAAEQVRKEEPQQSFLERYTNVAQDVILQGLKLVGVRYRFGGNDEDSGLDCSGFVRLVFKDTIGTSLPRTAREMSEMGQKIDTSQLKPGDLVFFNTMRRAFSHVGIYLGDNHFLHAPRTGAEVRIENMDSSYWMNRYNGARRIIDN
jgi:cell wall-associated NlpC family hydrolase